MLYSVNYVGYEIGGINRNCFLCLIKEQSLYIWRISNINLKKRIGKSTREELKAKIILSIYNKVRINVLINDLDKTTSQKDSIIESILPHYIRSSFGICTSTGPGTTELWNVRKLD